MASEMVSHLNNLLADRNSSPSKKLVDMLVNECESDSKDNLNIMLDQMEELLNAAFMDNAEQRFNSHVQLAKQYHIIGRTLYFKSLENILVSEKKKHPRNSISTILKEIAFHELLFICCLEIVIFCYNSRGLFPWILSVYGLKPYNFNKVIELLIREVDGLSRDVINHLNHIEKQILEELAWKRNSPIWNELQTNGNSVPSCEDVSLPNQIKPTLEGSGPVIMERTFSRTIDLSPHSAILTPPYTPYTSHHEADISNSRIGPMKNKLKRRRSLCLFFRKVYNLAGARFLKLCDQLRITDTWLRRCIWTCFEYSLIEYTSLMVDRHLDQLIMCAIYVICKVTKKNHGFENILEVYRRQRQPQTSSHVYRSVLLNKLSYCESKENMKGGSDISVITPNEEEVSSKCEPMDLTNILCSSSLPAPHHTSNPPSPSFIYMDGPSFVYENKGDLIAFYNDVYAPLLYKFVLKFSGDIIDTPPLSPLPGSPSSSSRLVSSNRPIFVSPLSNINSTQSPERPLCYSFNKSPPSDLHAINRMLHSGNKSTVKRNFRNDDIEEWETKRLCNSNTMRKLSTVFHERMKDLSD